MKKNRYIQPATDVAVVSVVNLMTITTVSNGDIPENEGSAHAPARGNAIYIN